MDCQHTYNDKLDTLNPSSKEKLCSICLKAEVERLKAEREDASALGDERIRRLEAENEKLKAEIEELKEESYKVRQHLKGATGY